MRRKLFFQNTSLTIFSFFWAFKLGASELEIPNAFADGETTSASEMNANFEAIKAAVNDNNASIRAISGSTASRSVFQGFSSGKVNGGAGVFAMQQQCGALASGSHVCTVSEIVNSPNNPNSLATFEEDARAWVFIGESSVSSASSDLIIPIIGLDMGYYKAASCSGYTSGLNSINTNGLTMNNNGAPSVTSLGGFLKSYCSSQLQVACCK